jgi:UDP-GlcNAc:undecaprenyl-phosphate GlcNAc-1-phosphate transferase
MTAQTTEVRTKNLPLPWEELVFLAERSVELCLWTPVGSFALLQYILAAFILIFILGIFDDLMPISPWKKLAGQILVAVILSYKAGVRVTNFLWFFGHSRAVGLGQL